MNQYGHYVAGSELVEMGAFSGKPFGFGMVRVRLGSITVNSFGFKVFCTFIAEFVQKGHKCKRNRLEDGHI